MSSSCSSVDLGIDADFDDVLTDSLLNDIELFAEHINRLKNSLDTNAYVPDGESKCVQVHAALSMVSQSVRDLLVRYPVFKTSNVLIPASQLVHSVKEINFDSSFIDSARTLQCIEKLEAAVGNTLRHSVAELIGCGGSEALLTNNRLHAFYRQKACGVFVNTVIG